MEALAGVRVVAFDKTGTLTAGATSVTAIETDGTPADEVLRLAAGLERSSEHPLARAIVAAAAERDSTRARPARLALCPAAGSSAMSRASRWRPDRGRWLADLGWRVPPELARRASDLEAAGASLVHVGWAGRVRGVLALGEALRPEAPAPSRRSGGWACRRCSSPAIAPKRRAHCRRARGGWLRGRPVAGGQAGRRGRLGARGGRVAMVGDGLNDAPVLAAADVGIAVGSATDLARETAGIVLPEGGLRLLPWVIELSWAVRRTILTNLLWAFGYNSIGLVLAVTGHLQPVIAAVLMAGSSLLVVLNSLRLERFAEPSDHPRPEDPPAADRACWNKPQGHELQRLDQRRNRRARWPRGSATSDTPETSSSRARTRPLLEASQPEKLDRDPVVIDLVAGDPGGEVDLVVDVARCRGRGLNPAVPAAAVRAADAVGGAGDDVQGAAGLDPVELVLLVLEAEVADRGGERDPADIAGGERAQTSTAARDTRTAPVSEPV